MFTAETIPDIVSQLTLEEKAALCSGADFWRTEEIDRLGIPSILMTDGPHGLRMQAASSDQLVLNESIPATCFPSAAGLGSTWDRDLLRRVGEALGAEARANGVAVLLGPGVNMKRTPLCGRNFEYFSEDPYLAGELASPMVSGIQSRGVGASLKHFAANNQETERFRVSAEIDERTLREIYLPAFEKVVTSAQPWTVMCSYNRINGTYSSQNRWLLTDVLRDEWGFDGVVVSDWGAVDDRVAGLAAGLDLEMPASGGLNDARIVRAVRDGLLDVLALDRAVTRLLTLAAKSQPAIAAPSSVDPIAHHALAREVAARTAVLLKNDDVLPLDAETIAETSVLIGEMARTPRYQGAGSSQVNPTHLDNALGALRGRGIAVPFAAGYTLAEAIIPESQRSDDELRAEAVELATGKTAVLFLGLPAADESEGYDRETMDLPESQLVLLREVVVVAQRTVVLLSNGSIVTVSSWNGLVDAIVELWLGGQAGGSAAIDLLLGDAAPSGRLAESIPEQLSAIPAQLNFPGENQTVRYGEGIFIGYRGLDASAAPVSYPFGHGLTYTTFEFSDLTVEETPITTDTSSDDAVLVVTAVVTNTGDRDGVSIPQLYLGRAASTISRAPRELKGFDRVSLVSRESRGVRFELTRRDLSHWDVLTHSWVVEAGELVVSVGASSRDLPLVTTVTITAPPIYPPLTAYSTVSEWLAAPAAGDALLSLMGQARVFLSPNTPDASMSAFLRQMPVAKIPFMGFADVLTVEQLDDLVTEYGHR
ncbi:MAG: glycoside hydrolase family 3 N-terminal domain-containing protein [Lacisediminihabitans sp.]